MCFRVPWTCVPRTHVHVSREALVIRQDSVLLLLPGRCCLRGLPVSQDVFIRPRGLTSFFKAQEDNRQIKLTQNTAKTQRAAGSRLKLDIRDKSHQVLSLLKPDALVCSWPSKRTRVWRAMSTLQPFSGNLLTCKAESVPVKGGSHATEQASAGDMQLN